MSRLQLQADLEALARLVPEGMDLTARFGDRPYSRVLQRIRNGEPVGYKKTKQALRTLPCFYCGKNPGGTIDHYMPLGLGGLDRPYNWRPCCQDCNTAKADMHPGVWEAQLKLGSSVRIRPGR